MYLIRQSERNKLVVPVVVVVALMSKSKKIKKSNYGCCRIRTGKQKDQLSRKEPRLFSTIIS